MRDKLLSLSLIALALVLTPAADADAQMPKRGTYASHFGWYATGKVFELEKGHAFFVGEFGGTNFNDEGKGFLHSASVVCPGSNDIRPSGIAQGVCIVTDPQGDKAFVVWKCTTDQPGPGGKCDGDFQWTGGTGKYAGLRGSNKFYGVTILPTNSGYSIWKGEWELP
jgi:hypothetical protein